jgi:hypothetical protein
MSEPMLTPANPSPSECFLNDVWCLYFHDPNDNNWTPSSYQLIATLSNVEDFQRVMTSVPQDLWFKGMFFIMREHVQPVWEDPSNANGGCFSMKVMRNHLMDTWVNVCAAALGETIVKEKALWDLVTGVSISPKKSYILIRVWIRDTTHTDTHQFNFHQPAYTEVLFKVHQPDLPVNPVNPATPTNPLNPVAPV